MNTAYITREGLSALINGISNYFVNGREITQYSGVVNGKSCHWNEKGQYSTHQVLGINQPHPLDLVDWYDEPVEESPGVYYIELKKEEKNVIRSNNRKS